MVLRKTQKTEGNAYRAHGGKTGCSNSLVSCVRVGRGGGRGAAAGEGFFTVSCVFFLG